MRNEAWERFRYSSDDHLVPGSQASELSVPLREKLAVSNRLSRRPNSIHPQTPGLSRRCWSWTRSDAPPWSTCCNRPSLADTDCVVSNRPLGVETAHEKASAMIMVRRASSPSAWLDQAGKRTTAKTDRVSTSVSSIHSFSRAMRLLTLLSHHSVPGQRLCR